MTNLPIVMILLLSMSNKSRTVGVLSTGNQNYVVREPSGSVKLPYHP